MKIVTNIIFTIFINNDKESSMYIQKAVNIITPLLSEIKVLKSNGSREFHAKRAMKYVDSISSEVWQNWSNKIFARNLYDTNPDKIRELSSKKFSNSDIFYHGTRNGRKIRKQGFSLIPKWIQAAFGPRELGSGVYVTPSKFVAAHYAKSYGEILPIRVKFNKIAEVNQKQYDLIIRTILPDIKKEERNSFTLEYIIRKLFLKNGYNAAYSEHSIACGMYDQHEFVEAMSGGTHSQLAIYKPEDVEILDKSLKEILLNHKLQIIQALRKPKLFWENLKNWKN